MSKFLDFLGTTAAKLQIAISGVVLKNSSGNLLVRNAADNADAEITTSKANISGDSLVLNSDAANTGADRSITIQRPTTGMSAAYTLTLPVDDGSPNQVLATDGNGVTSWITAANTSDKLAVDTTSLAFGTTSPLTLFTLPANAVVQAVRVIIDTAFNGSPSLSIGITGSTSKYLPSSSVALTSAATTIYESYPGLPAVGTTENLIATYSAGSASAGAARIEVEYVVPA